MNNNKKAATRDTDLSDSTENDAANEMIDPEDEKLHELYEQAVKKSFFQSKVFRVSLLIGSTLLCLSIVLMFVLIFVSVKNSNQNREIIYSLQEILAMEYNYEMAQYPELASYMLGKGAHDALLTNYSVGAIQARLQHYQLVRERLQKLQSNELDALLFAQVIHEKITRLELRTYLMPISQLDGPQLDLPALVQDTLFDTEQDFDFYLQRLSGIPVLLEQITQLMRQGAKEGMIMPQITISPVIVQIETIVNVSNTVDSVFYAPFKSELGELLPAEKRMNALSRVSQASLAFQRFKLFIESEYLPVTRHGIAAAELPNGSELYSFLVRYYTTLPNVTADGLHELGLLEVARISTEMNKVAKELHFNGTLQQFLTSLTQMPQFYAKTEEEFLSFIRDTCKKAEPMLPKLFKTLPRCPYGIFSIPANEAPHAPAAYYVSPDTNCTRPGKYFVNTYKLSDRPKFIYPSTSLHEAVPGHHLQQALALEVQVPKYRLLADWTAYVEGWALYAESLGFAMNMYDNLYYKFGTLGDEMLRACRLVVDTGMHAKLWSRDRAIKYMQSYTPMGMADIIAEIDRYIAWPGQALAYKTGQLKILEWRDKIKRKLGTNFDIREFHQAVLEQGALPLEVLEKLIYTRFEVL